MQHYLRPDVLQATGAQSVTAWGQQFTKSETTLKPKMTGDGFEQVTRIGKYVNVPELMRINAAFTDTVQRDQLETDLPEVVGGDRILLRRDPSPQVRAYIDDLSHRIDTLSANSDDNMLSITGDGRRVALDGRLVDLDADDDGGRSQAVVDQIVEVHQRTKDRQFLTETGDVSAVTGGLQIVFLDQSTPQDGWNMYDQIKDDLVAAGMDGDAIRFIHEAETDEARDALFDACREGHVSVLLGSTQKMGTGTNVQRRAVALHHVDCPWRPADLEQREGRIIRQGNQNEHVELYAYATDNTFDVASWDMIARKAKFIGQMKRGELAGREMEDVVAGLEFSASRAASELSGDPRIQQLAEMQLRIEQLESLQQTWQTERSKNRVMLRHNDARVEYLATNMPALAALADNVRDTSADRFRFTTAQGATMTDRGDAGAALASALRQQAARTDTPNYQQPSEMTRVGQLGGIDLGVLRHGKQVQLVVMAMPSIRREWSVDNALGSLSETGVIRSAENMVAGLGEEHAKWQAEHDQLIDSRAALAEVLEAPFEHRDELHQLQHQAQDLAAEMGLNEDDTEEAEQNPTVSGQQLTEVFGERATRSYRDNDVVLYQRAYYRIGIVRDDEGRFRDMYGYPPDEPRPENLAEEGRLLHSFDTMTVIERDWAQLSAMEQAVLSRDENYDVYLRNSFELETGDRVQFVSREDNQTLQVGTYQNGVFVTEDQQRFRLMDVDQHAGFLALGKTSPEEQAAQAAEALERAQYRTASQLIPGEVLTEDVEGFGYAGDVVRCYGTGYRQSTYAVSPDTGTVRAMDLSERPPFGGRSWPTIPAMMLSAAEKQAVFGADRLATEIGQLRPGDRVVSTEIDDRAAVKEMVTILEVTGADRKDITYRGQDEVVKTSAKMDTTAVEVHDRTKGALTGHELLYLAGHVRDPEPKTVAEVMDSSAPGQHVFVELDEFQPYNRTGMAGSMAARVAGMESGQGFAPDRLVLEASTGQEIKLTPDRTNATITLVDQPVDLSDVLPMNSYEFGANHALDGGVPVGAVVSGSQHLQRTNRPANQPNNAPGPELPERGPDRQADHEWLQHHVQVQHISNPRPSPGIG